MEKMLGFGRPLGTVMQTCFVVPDLAKAIDYYVRTLNVGPFFVLPHRKQPDRVYRGTVAPVEVSLAMGFAGNMQIELIEQHDQAPSLFREAIAQRGYGFHHVGIAHDDVPDVLPTYLAEGFEVVGRSPVPTGGEVLFLEPPEAPYPGFIELLPATAEMDERFTRFWRASVDWDGSDAIRSPKKSRIWVLAISTAMPLVNPTTTGRGR